MQLPESVQEIADVIGRERALFLIGQLPRYFDPRNQNERVILYVPKRLPLDHRLVQILGWADANKLVKEFGGEILKPSNCNFVYKKHRDANIVRLFGEGNTITVLAEWFGVCERTVKNLVREKPQEGFHNAANDNAPQSTKHAATNE